ncbi:hypothetical protein F511_40192 [Dorcoceras hygrometricum]|uniref:Uncharacterized protein n=1 Tax=Dorcoceras hygrometricum TaxID=472368 RepID=A0A2Z7BSQ1_9LAMI|nr:hypothetical protein F511_40192 [Dorcoceras hygrometricum]
MVATASEEEKRVAADCLLLISLIDLISRVSSYSEICEPSAKRERLDFNFQEVFCCVYLRQANLLDLIDDPSHVGAGQQMCCAPVQRYHRSGVARFDRLPLSCEDRRVPINHGPMISRFLDRGVEAT